MKTTVVASQNPVKLKASLLGFQRMFSGEQFDLRGVFVPSGVPDQPTSDAQTLEGATHRAERASELEPQVDFWVGIEGGIEDTAQGMETFAWVVVKSNSGKIGQGKTGTFFLPERIAELVRQGKELGEADDIVFGRKNSKQENGAVGLLTQNVIHRTDFYVIAVILALIPFKNETLY
ncbi:MAG: inosine/xanthosine triphosphatase [Patescibacteria group bacterium]